MAKCMSTVERREYWCFKLGEHKRARYIYKQWHDQLLVSGKLCYSSLSSEESTVRKRPLRAVETVRTLMSDLAGLEKQLMDWSSPGFGKQTA